MHELSLAEAIVEACAARAQGARVARVRLQIGQLSAVMPEAIQFCFDVCAQDTALAGAALDIIETPGRAVCRDCRTAFALDTLLANCPCGSTDFSVVAGDELTVKDMEFA